MTKIALAVKDLHCRAGFKKILSKIHLVLHQGEFVGLLGGSGAGKSVLMKTLCGYREASSGEIWWQGEKEINRHSIGYVPQKDIVHSTLTARQALDYAARLRDPSGHPQQREQLVQSVLGKLGLEEHAQTKIARLSGGQRKRVSIGVELLDAPSLFFLDEPTAGLDPGLERQTMKLLAAMAEKGQMVMVSTHLMEHVDLFHIIVFIHKGYLAYFGPAHGIKEFMGVNTMVDLYEKKAEQDPETLHLRYMGSPWFQHLGRRLARV